MSGSEGAGVSVELATLQTYLRASAAHHRDVVRSGPFVLNLDRSSGSPGLNYAIPDDGAAPSSADVEALLAAFAARELTPALEYLPGLSPNAEAPLLAAGLRVHARIPVMMASVRTAVDVAPPAGVGVILADARTEDTVLARIYSTQSKAFGDFSGVVEPTDVERLRRWTREGVVAFAYADGEIVAGGVALVIREGMTELAGIAVDADYRGRGIAGALTSVLARAAIARGATMPFLTPADEAAGRVYARAGFAIAGEMLHLRSSSTSAS